MGRQITFKRIIVSGLCVYIVLTVYFLLSIISTEKVDYSYEEDATKQVKSDLAMDSVHKTDNTPVEVRRGKYEIKFGKNDVTTETRKSLAKRGTPKPTKPPRWKRTHSKKSPKRFRQLSTVNQNFSEIAPQVFVYSAFLDDRYNTTYIRLTVIAPSGRKKRWSGIFCIFNNRHMTELIYYETCENHMMRNAYYEMSCVVPTSQVSRFNGITPLTISPSKDAEPEYYKFITVVNNRALVAADDTLEMRKFAVCIPPLFGNINVLRLVEFIELTRILGASHFVFYPYGVSDDILRVLQHYKKHGVVTLMPWHSPVGKDIWYYGQSAAVGDCLLRNMYINKLVAFNDIDEFIVPHATHNWETLVDLVNNQTVSTGQNISNIAVYRFKSSYFHVPKRRAGEKITDVPQMDKLLMDKFLSLSETKRTSIFNHIRTKMLVNPLRVFELGIHHLSKQQKEEYFCLNVEPKVAFLHHYRKCADMCSELVDDTTALQFKHPLINNTIQVLKDLKYSKTSLIRALL